MIRTKNKTLCSRADTHSSFFFFAFMVWVHTTSQVILPLPDPVEWAAAAAADNNASYHQPLEFAPTAPAHAPRRSSVFCGVSVSREEKVADRVGGDNGGGGGGRGAGKAGKVTVVSFVPTMSLTNLLATPADVRLSCPWSSLSLQQHAGGGTTIDEAGQAVGNAAAAGGSSNDDDNNEADGVWSAKIERGTGVSWFHCPPDEEVNSVC